MSFRPYLRLEPIEFIVLSICNTQATTNQIAVIHTGNTKTREAEHNEESGVELRRIDSSSESPLEINSFGILWHCGPSQFTRNQAGI